MTKEEILKYVWEELDGYDLTWDSHCEALAEQLLRDGWCRQKEAQWIPLKDFHNEMYACSNCQLHIHKDLLEHFHFCPKCGAKMKIAAELSGINPSRCGKCAYELYCSKDKDNERSCPDYKRDATDGGYYG